MNLVKLKEARQKKGYTQAYMAEKLGFKTRASYCLIEKGVSAVSVVVAGKIAEILDIPKNEIGSVFFDQ